MTFSFKQNAVKKGANAIKKSGTRKPFWWRVHFGDLQRIVRHEDKNYKSLLFDDFTFNPGHRQKGETAVDPLDDLGLEEVDGLKMLPPVQTLPEDAEVRSGSGGAFLRPRFPRCTPLPPVDDLHTTDVIEGGQEAVEINDHKAHTSSATADEDLGTILEGCKSPVHSDAAQRSGLSLDAFEGVFYNAGIAGPMHNMSMTRLVF